MTSTVTTSTVSSLTATTAPIFFASMALIVAILLLSLLIQKEVISSSAHPVAKTMSRVLNIAIVPLFMAFAVSGIINVIGLLQQ